MKNETIFAFIDNIFSQLCSISDAIFDYAEIGYQEFRSSALLRQGLERHGFAIEDLSAQVPNAFLARTGSGVPTVAILAEFDALPGSSQLAGVAEPQQITAPESRRLKPSAAANAARVDLSLKTRAAGRINASFARA